MRTAFVGSKAIGLAILEFLRRRTELVAAVTFDDRPDARSRYETLIAAGATEGPIPDVDLVVVAGWYRLIPSSLLSRTTVLGIHHSLLPKYRGGSPLVWAMIDGEEEVGTTLFQMTDDLDAGPIWGQRSVPVGNRYIGDVMAQLDAEAVGLVEAFLDGRLEPRAQTGPSTRVRSRKPADGLIDLTRPVAELERFIRAQSRPYPGAFIQGDDGRTIIWRASGVGDRLVIEESERA